MSVRNLFSIVVLAVVSTTGCGGSPVQGDGTVTVTTTTPVPPIPAIPQLTPGSVAASPTGAGVPFTTLYTFRYAASPTGGVPPYTFAWTFGDGGAGAGASPVHIYEITGDFVATGTVTDTRGTTATASVPVSVRSLTGRWTATGFGLDADRINIIQNASDVTASVNSTNGYGLGTGVGAASNPRSLTITIAFTTPPTPVPPAAPLPAAAITYRGTLDDSLLTWTGTVSGYPGCPCNFTATRPSASALAVGSQ